MALRKIVKEGDPVLERVCRPVEVFDKKLATLVEDMKETLADANGAGLAAPQVGIAKRLCIVVDDDDTMMTLINPEIIATKGEQIFTEGCLSVPGIWGKTRRPAEVTVRAYDEKGKVFTATRTGITAVCFCHEIDHLDGKLFRNHVFEYIKEKTCKMKNILFMGSPDFAAESLKALVESGYNVTGVVSQPDKPRGRGHSFSPTAVKAYALTQNIPVYTPTTLKNGELQEVLDLHKPDIIIVVAYGKILPEYVLNYPKYGCVNIHASLLPMYRGASPINFVLVNGEKVTGITSMLMDKGLDTGDMLIKRSVEIEDTDNAGTLHDKLAALGAEVLKETVDGLFEGRIVPEKQVGQTCYAPLIDNDMRKLDMSETTGNIYNKIRGFSPFPTAYTTFGGKIIKVYAAVPTDIRPEWEYLTPGTFLSSKAFTVKTADGAITFTDIAPEGKKRMSGEAYMAGLRLSAPYGAKLD